MTLLCTVRTCHAPLARKERRFVCASGHSFDIARSGYVNLLQPQDRRSQYPGDTKEAVMARRRFLERFGPAIALPPLEQSGTLLDVGCGEGFYLNLMSGIERHGLDISTPAIDAAARKYKDCFFVVANADRFLPYATRSFALITSITARTNPPEFHRILADDGRVLVALPGPDDLIELREAVLGEAKLIDRTHRTIEEFGPYFELEKHDRVRHVVHLDRDAIHDVMTSSYRGARTKQRERLSALEELDVTLSRDLLLFTSSRQQALRS